MQASELRPGQWFEHLHIRYLCVWLDENKWAAYVAFGQQWVYRMGPSVEVTPLAVTGWDEPQAVEPKSDKPSIAKELNIDAGTEQFELARALHRVVRAMHDGHCPKCGYLASSMEFEPSEGYHVCPECLFAITKEEADEALAMFLPYMQKNYDKFVAWQLHGRFVKPQPQSELIPRPTNLTHTATRY